MTKQEFYDHLKAGYYVDDAFVLSPGQDCDIYKSDKFEAGDQIIYIPDIYLNEITICAPVLGDEVISDIVACCYTGNDFIDICGGDTDLAERLFWYCDWQHPSSALPEVTDDD